MQYRIVIDAGHGGRDNGATSDGRKEKDDALRLALAVGNILSNAGIDVDYTRTSDVYNSPLEKAVMGNNADANLFVSLHRNASGSKNKATGVETLIYDNKGIKSEIADNINENLEKLGFRNRGTKLRNDLVVLKRTKMPALLVEVGFIDNDNDNALFDREFYNIAQAIADGILDSLDVPALSYTPTYKVQLGNYPSLQEALATNNTLHSMGFDSYIVS